MTEIIENTEDARDECKLGGHGYENVEITKKDIDALLKGKVLAVDVNEEYVSFITLKVIK